MTYTISGAVLGSKLSGQDTVNNGNSINIKENNNKAEGVQGAFSAIVMSGGVKAASQDNTYESLIKEADDVKSQIMASAETAKLSLKALAMKLSGAGAVELDEDGFNLTDATSEDMVNIIEKIRIELSMHCEDYVAYGTTPDSEAIESVAGSAGMASAVEAKLNSIRIPTDEANIDEVTDALDKASELSPLTEKMKNYMVLKEIPPTIAGILQAGHACSGKYGAGDYAASPVSDDQFESMRPQIEKIIENAGLPVNNHNLNNARQFLNSNIPVTEKNILYKAELDNIDLEDMSSDNKKNVVLNMIIDNLAVGGKAIDTPLTANPSVLSQVRDALDTLDTVNYSDVENVVKDGKEVTLENLKETHFAYKNIDEALSDSEKMKAGGQEIAAGTEGQKAAEEKTTAAYNFLLETRILMTASAGVFLAKNGVSLMTVSVDKLAMNLRYVAADDTDYKNVLTEPEEIINQVFQVKKSLLEISDSPLEVFGKLLGSSSVQEKLTIATFSHTGGQLKRDFDRMNHNYEMVGTEVRKDLGDSVDKAVKGSAADILADLGFEDNRNNREAIHILAMNGMEMSAENVATVKEIYSTLNNLINNMKPETVLNMLKNGVNPMEDDIRDVNEYLNELNNAASEKNEEKFSKFLFKLDRTNGIDADTRKDFIGVYQMMNIFRKDAGTAIGAVLKQGMDMTMGNLLTAYNSRKSAGMDFTVDNETGIAEVAGNVNYYMNIFKGSEHLVTPNTLKNVDNRYDYKAQSVEKFCEELKDNYDAEIEAQLNEEYIKEVTGAVPTDLRQENRYVAMLSKADMDITFGNVAAAKQLLESGTLAVSNRKSARWKVLEDNPIEKIGHREELEEMFDSIKQAAAEDLNDAFVTRTEAQPEDHKTEKTQEQDITFDRLNELRINNRVIGIISNLAIRNDYRIPVATENGVGMINLTLVSDNDDRGRISVKLDSETFGELSVEAKIDGSNMWLFVIGKSSDGLDDVLEELSGTFKEQFGMESVHTGVSINENVPYITYDESEEKTPTDKLFAMAETIVGAFAGVN